MDFGYDGWLTKISSASFIKEGDVLVDDGFVEVSSEVPRDTLTQNVEDGSSHADADAGDEDDAEHVEAVGVYFVIFAFG